MSTGFDHYFWQLRELQRSLDQLEPQIRLLNTIPNSVRDQIEVLSNIRDRFNLPSDYLREVARIQDLVDAQRGIEQLRGLYHVHSSSLEELVRHQDEIDDLARQVSLAGKEFQLPSQRILDSLASTEALLELNRMDRQLIDAAVQPQLAFQEFAHAQLEMAASASEPVRENRALLVDIAADLLEKMSSGLHLALLMQPAPLEIKSLPRPPVNIYTELSEELAGLDLEQPDVDIEGAVEESSPGQVAELGARLVRLVYDLNVEAEREGHPPVFKPTTKGLYASSIIPTFVATDERSFNLIVDNLYFLLYEGTGEAKRLRELGSDDELTALWRLKHLRRGARHDVDHGPKTDIVKKNDQIGKAYKSLIGAATPRTRSDWSQAQVRLYRQLVDMLETLWFGAEKEEIRHSDPSRWDLDRLAASGAEEDLALAELGLAEWFDALDEEDRG